MKKIKAWAKNLKRQIFILYFAYRDDRVPWYAKLFAVCIVAYAFSPIDLIPDFIPILGYLDDLIIIPFSIMLALKMIPQRVIEDCEWKATDMIKKEKPRNWIVGSFIILIWLLTISWIIYKAYQYFDI